MKIVWATPYNVKSAIGRFSRNIVEELVARSHDVTLVRLESDSGMAYTQLPAKIATYSWNDPKCADIMSSADAVFVNIGDYYDFHAGAIELTKSGNCIGIFHDWAIVGFFYGWMHSVGNVALAKDILTQYHGDDAWRQFTTLSGEAFYEAAVRNFPLTGWMADRLNGAVVHSQFYKEFVSRWCPGPVHKIPLAYPALESAGLQNSTKASEDGRLTLYTLGMVNPNKRIEQVIRAIGSDEELRRNVSYVVDGRVAQDLRGHLEDMARKHGVDFRLNGEVSDDQLTQSLNDADVICCLRYPALEGASASAIEAMQSGKPVIVSDTGFYAELPDEAVYRISVENEHSDLIALLRRLISVSAAERQAFGKAAAHWARTTFSPSNYCDHLETLAQEVNAADAPLRLGEELGTRIASLGMGPQDPLCTRLEAELGHLFG